MATTEIDLNHPTRALVLGAGGPVGRAWELGVASGFIAQGVTLRTADAIIGTSAGAIAGAHLALDLDVSVPAVALSQDIAAIRRVVRTDEGDGALFSIPLPRDRPSGNWATRLERCDAERRAVHSTGGRLGETRLACKFRSNRG